MDVDGKAFFIFMTCLLTFSFRDFSLFVRIQYKRGHINLAFMKVLTLSLIYMGVKIVKRNEGERKACITKSFFFLSSFS